jgi:hypothetical protein
VLVLAKFDKLNEPVNELSIQHFRKQDYVEIFGCPEIFIAPAEHQLASRASNESVATFIAFKEL